VDPAFFLFTLALLRSVTFRHKPENSLINTKSDGESGSIERRNAENSMKKFLWAGAALVTVAIAFMVIKRVSAKQTGAPSETAEVVRVTRRDVGSSVKATGVMKPLV